MGNNKMMEHKEVHQYGCKEEGLFCQLYEENRINMLRLWQNEMLERKQYNKWRNIKCEGVSMREQSVS